MIRVLEIMKIGNGRTALVCDMFEDKVVTNRISSNIGYFDSFVVEKPKYCFSQPTTRNIVLFGSGDYSSVNKIRFV